MLGACLGAALEPGIILGVKLDLITGGSTNSASGVSDASAKVAATAWNIRKTRLGSSRRARQLCEQGLGALEVLLCEGPGGLELRTSPCGGRGGQW